MAGPLSQKSWRPARQKTLGDLRHRVTIQKLSDTPERDESLAEIPVWETVAQVWASVEPMSATEAMVNGQVQASVTYQVVIRHRDGVTPKMRLLWATGKPANRVLNVVQVLPRVGTANGLELVCEEEVTS